MNRDKRRQYGVHYTVQSHILRILRPLVLDELVATLQQARSAPALRTFLERLGTLTFLDPACGTGNFLVAAYRTLRQLEAEALERSRDVEGFYTTHRCVSLSQFYGIEIDAKAAARAMVELSRAAADEDARALQKLDGSLGSPAAPRIMVGNALRMNWSDVLPAEHATFVLGNPPFVGMAWMSRKQRQDRALAFSKLDASGLRIGRLDYAAAFFAKSIAYGMGHDIRFSFVVTNSICQGEHARSLGPLFARHGYHFDFAHRAFTWTSDGPKKANVHVVVIGFSRSNSQDKRIYEGDDGEATVVRNINMYLADGPNIIPAKRRTPLVPGYPLGTKGSQPTDGGHLVVEAADLDDILNDSIARKYVRRYMQATEFLWDKPRYCLWLVDAPAADIEASPVLRARVQAVRRARERSRTSSVRDRANHPALFTQIRQPRERYLVLPEVSSEKRQWIPAAFLDPEVIAGNKLITFAGASVWLFGMLQSSMFMAWVRALSGRMKSDISISPDLTYSTFPFPEADEVTRARVEHAATHILSVRQTHANASLGELYDPRRIPEDLERAHAALDKEVDALFARGRKFVGDASRLEVLFERYAQWEAEAASCP